MQMLNVVVARMGQAPIKAEELVQQRGVTADALHAALDRAKKVEIEVAGMIANQRGQRGRPVYGNSAQRAAEEQTRLAKNKVWNELQDTIVQERTALRECDARLESLRMQAKADEAIMNLVAGLMANGKVQDAEEILSTYTGSHSQATNVASQQVRPAKERENKGVQTGVFTVLETRLSNPNTATIRAFCEGEDGKYAVYGKNGVGTTLAAAIGRQVRVQYRQADKGLYAVAAEVV